MVLDVVEGDASTSHVPQSNGHAALTNCTTHASAESGHSPPKFVHVGPEGGVVPTVGAGVRANEHTPRLVSASLVFPPEMHVPSRLPVLSALLQPHVPTQSFPHVYVLHGSTTVVVVDVDDGAVVTAFAGHVLHISGHSARATSPTNRLSHRETSLHSPGLSSLPSHSVGVVISSTSGSGSGVDVVVVVVVVAIVGVSPADALSALSLGVHKPGHVIATIGPIIVLSQKATTNTPEPHGSVVVVVAEEVVIVVAEVVVVVVVVSVGTMTVMVPTIQGCGVQKY